MNFKENSATADNIGGSTDNVYYFEGINVTDPVTGTFGANLNTEIIQEQKVITGGIPAEYVGAAGLISTVITKSGSNLYSGSYNYFFRNDGFVAENDHTTSTAAFSTKDTAFTIGGPALKGKLWGFGSFRYTSTNAGRERATDTLAFLRKAETIQKQGFAKGTWAPTQYDIGDVHIPQRSADALVRHRRLGRQQPHPQTRAGRQQLLDRLQQDVCQRVDGRRRSNYTTRRSLTSPSVTDKSRNTVAFQTAQTSERWPTSSSGASVRTSPKRVPPCRPAGRRSTSGSATPSRAVSSGRGTKTTGTWNTPVQTRLSTPPSPTAFSRLEA